MMTNTMMFGSLVAMATVQAWVRCPEGAFLITITVKQNQVTQARNQDHAYNGLCNEPKMVGWR